MYKGCLWGASWVFRWNVVPTNQTYPHFWCSNFLGKRCFFIFSDGYGSFPPKQLSFPVRQELHSGEYLLRLIKFDVVQILVLCARVSRKGHNLTRLCQKLSSVFPVSLSLHSFLRWGTREHWKGAGGFSWMSSKIYFSCPWVLTYPPDKQELWVALHSLRNWQKLLLAGCFRQTYTRTRQRF